MRHRSARRFVGLIGSIQKQAKIICSLARLDRFRKRCPPASNSETRVRLRSSTVQLLRPEGLHEPAYLSRHSSVGSSAMLKLNTSVETPRHWKQTEMADVSDLLSMYPQAPPPDPWAGAYSQALVLVAAAASPASASPPAGLVPGGGHLGGLDLGRSAEEAPKGRGRCREGAPGGVAAQPPRQ